MKKRSAVEPEKLAQRTGPPTTTATVPTTETGDMAAMLRLQRSAGNRAVSRLVSSDSPKVIRRSLTKEADAALTLAVNKAGTKTTSYAESKFLEEESFELNNEITYGQAKTIIDAKLPTKQQKDVIDVGGGGLFSKKNDEAANVRKLVQAFLLKGIAKPLGNLDAHPQRPTEPEKVPKWEKTKLEQYAKKSLVVRDQFKPLVSMKPSAPEVKAFLETEGFAEPDTADPQPETGDKTHKGPRIEVRASFSGKAGSKFPMRIHLFIVYTAIDGKQWYVRGGPGPQVDDPEFGALEDGYVTAEVGRFTASSIDYDPSATSVTVMKGPAAAEKFDTLLAAAERINAAKVPYRAQLGGMTSMDGENCNAAAWTILNLSGVPTKKPTGIHPGWGKPLGRQTWDFLKKEHKKKIAKGELTLPAERNAGALGQFGEEFSLDAGKVMVGAGGAKLYKDRLGADVIAVLAEDSEVEVLRTAEGTALVKEVGGKARTGYMLISKLVHESDDDSSEDSDDDIEEEKVPAPRAAKVVAGNAIMYDEKGRSEGNWFDDGQVIEVIDDAYQPGKDGKFLVQGRILGGAVQKAYIFGNNIALDVVAEKPKEVAATDPGVIAGATHRVVEGGAESSGEYGSVGDEIAAGTPVKLAEGFEGNHQAWEKVLVQFKLGGENKYGFIFFDKLVGL